VLRCGTIVDLRYIKKLREKVTKQLIVDSDRTRIEDRMAMTHENYRITREQSLKIILPAPGENPPRPATVSRPRRRS